MQKYKNRKILSLAGESKQLQDSGEESEIPVTFLSHLSASYTQVICGVSF